MKNILITSSGFLLEPIRKEIVNFLPRSERLSAAYIPTASRVVKDDTYARRDVEIMQKLGMNVSEIDLSEFKEEELEARIREHTFMYVQGGNPYWLLKQMRASGFDKIAHRLLAEAMPYIGKSAGAYILAPEVVVPTWYESDWGRFDVTDLKGMGEVPFVWAAHFDPSNERMLNDIQRGMKETPYPVRAITNTQALLVRGENAQMVGEGKEYDLYHERFNEGDMRPPREGWMNM